MDLQVRALLATIAVVGFALAPLALRAVLQRRWTGSTGLKLHRLGTTTPERITLVCLSTAAGGLALGVLLPLFGHALGGPDQVPAAVAVTAFAVAMLGIALTFWSQVAMGASWRIGLDRGERTDLVTNGPYRWVRNPIYTSMLAFLGGVVVLLPNLATIIAVAAAFIGIEVVVRAVEEPYLLAEHGARYRAWRDSAGRFVPRFGRSVRA